MGKRTVKLRYKDMLAIKHALMASVAAKRSMVERFTEMYDSSLSERIVQLKKDIVHEEALAKLMNYEARCHVGGGE